ncbi:MAG: exo-alpha-sialidase [Planctomycetes bacterium]|nr:exo-alpha-sialidase [Planctomycetota bacterium]
MLRLPWMLLLCSSSALATQKTPDVRIDVGDPPGSAESLYLRVVASGSAVYVVWQDRRVPAEYHVYFNRSLDGGASWLAAATRLDVTTGAGEGQLALGAALYLVYGGFDGNVHFRSSIDQGASWSADAPLAAGARPRIAADGDDVYLIYESTRNGAADIYFNRSLDGGVTWLPSDARLDAGDPAGAASSFLPELAVSGGHLYAAWLDQRNDPFNLDLYLNASSDGGDNWLPSDVRLDTGRAAGTGFSNLQHLAAQGSSIYVAWRDTRGDGGTYFNRSSDGGATWLASDLRVDHPPVGHGYGGYPALAIAGSGAATDVYVAWSDDRDGLPPLGTGALYLAHSTDSGATWPAVDQPLSHALPVGAGDAGGTALLAQGSTVYASWWYRAADGGVFFNRSLDRGATWLATDVRLNVGDAPGDPGVPDPQLALSSGSVFVAWEDGRNDIHLGRRDIYFNLALGHQPYGVGLAGSGGLVPVLASTSAPAPGQTLTLAVTLGLGGASGILALSLAGPAAIPVFGGTLLVKPPLIQRPFVLGGAGGGAGAGATAIFVQLPNLSALIGRRLDAQAVMVDPGAPAGLALSGGLETWVL